MTESERIEKLEQLVSVLLATTPAATTPGAPQTVSMLQVTPEQSAAIQKLLQHWIPLPPTSSGEFDPMDYLAANRGWLPLIVDEAMTVSLGKKKYTIRRDA